MRLLAPHEGGSRAFDRAVRHRRGLAGDAGDGGVDRSSRSLRSRRRCAICCGRKPRVARLSPPDPDRPEEGSGLIVLAMGKMGAGELNYSSDIDLIVFFDPAAPTLAPGYRAAAVLRARHARPVADAAAAHRRRLCLPGRSALAAGSGLDAGRDLDRSGAGLLRAGRADLGARRHDQGAALRRRSPRQARRCSRKSRPSSGASIWISLRLPTFTT